MLQRFPHEGRVLKTSPLLLCLFVCAGAWAQDGASIHAGARLSYQRTNSFPTDTLGTHLWGAPLPVEPF